MEFDRSGQAIRSAISGDYKERNKALNAFPEISEQLLLNNYVNAGYGTLKEAQEILESKGAEYISKLLRVKMIQQEESD